MDQFTSVSSSASSKKPSLSKPRFHKLRKNAPPSRRPPLGFQESPSDSTFFNPFRSERNEARVSERSGAANFDAGAFVYGGGGGGGGRSVKSPDSSDGSVRIGLEKPAADSVSSGGGVFVFGSGVKKIADLGRNLSAGLDENSSDVDCFKNGEGLGFAELRDDLTKPNLESVGDGGGFESRKQEENVSVLGGLGSLSGLDKVSSGLEKPTADSAKFEAGVFVFGSRMKKIADLGLNSSGASNEESQSKLSDETRKQSSSNCSAVDEFEKKKQAKNAFVFRGSKNEDGSTGGTTDASEKPGVGSSSFGSDGGLSYKLPDENEMRKMNLSNGSGIANKVPEGTEKLNVGKSTESVKNESVGCDPGVSVFRSSTEYGSILNDEGLEKDKEMGSKEKVDAGPEFVFGNRGNVCTSFGNEFKSKEHKSDMGSIPSSPSGSPFSFTGKPGEFETPHMEFKTPKQDTSRLTKESLFPGTNQNIPFSVKKRDDKSTRMKKKKSKSRQSATPVHQIFPNKFVSVESKSNENPEVDSNGSYSPMDYSPYHEHSREPSVASVDSINFASHDNKDDDKRNSSADSAYLDEQIFEFEKVSNVSKHENVGLDSNVRVAPMEDETGFFERQASGGGAEFTFSTSLKGLGESKFTFSTSCFDQVPSSVSKDSKRRKNKSKSGQNPSISTPNARVPLASPLPDLIPHISTSGLLDLLGQKSTSSVPQSVNESNTDESRESGLRQEPTGSTTVNVPTQEACEKWRYRGNQAYADGYLSKAEDYYTRGINSVPLKDIPSSCIQPLTLCYSNRAATRMSLGRMREALSDCKMAVSIDPDFLKARVRVANCHLALGEIVEALKEFKDCLQSEKDISSNKKYLNEAVDGLQKAQQVTDLTGQAAELLLRRTPDDASNALALISKALSISPHSESLLEMKAESLLMMRNYEEVIKLCEQTLHLAEQSSNLTEVDSQLKTEYIAAKLWRWHLISKSYFYLGKLEEALELLQKIEEVKAAVDNYTNRSAESSTSFAITVRKLLHLKSAGNEAFQAGRHSEAVECYSAALACNAESRPFTAVCFCNRAAAYQALGQITDAIADCSLAIALDPSYVKAISRRATLHEMIRDYGQAANDLNRLISLLEKQVEVNQSGAMGRSTSNGTDLNKARSRLAKMEEESRKGISLNMYMIMGVEPSSSAADVKKAYRKAALRHHPDKAGQFLVKNDNVDDGLWKEVAAEIHADADRLFKMIGEAYSILSDPTKRQQYDDEEEMRTTLKKGNYGSTAPKTSSYSYSSYYEKNMNRNQWRPHGSSYQRG